MACWTSTRVVRTRESSRSSHSLNRVDTGLRNKGVLVTGASGGIGAACARAFAAESARVLVHSAAGGVASLALLLSRRYVLARGAAAIAVVSVLWGWAVAQYPYLLPDHVTVEQAAAGETTLAVMLAGLLIGAVLVVPSLVWLYALFQRSAGPDAR